MDINAKVLIIIPAYNEQDNIVDVINDIKNNASLYDYLVINDCSTDKTKNILLENNINFISMPVNMGIGGTVQTGFKYAYANGYDIVIQFDGDGQHKARYIPEMVKIISDNKANIVIGSRFLDKQGYQSTFFRRLGIKYFKTLIWLMSGISITDPTSGFRACNLSVMEMFSIYYPQDYPEPESIMSVIRKKFKIAEISVEMSERNGGKSSIGVFNSIYYMLKVTLAIIIDKIKPQMLADK